MATDAPLKPKKVKLERVTKTKTGKKNDADAIPRSRKPRAIAAGKKDLMAMAVEADHTLEDVDLLIHVLKDKMSSIINQLKPTTAPTTVTTKTPQPATKPTMPAKTTKPTQSTKPTTPKPTTPKPMTLKSTPNPKTPFPKKTTAKSNAKTTTTTTTTTTPEPAVDPPMDEQADPQPDSPAQS